VPSKSDDANNASSFAVLVVRSSRRRQPWGNDSEALQPIIKLSPTFRRACEFGPPRRRLVREVAATISTLGFCVPILIGKDNVVIDGEVRIEAAKLLGLDRAPCVRIDHLSNEEQRLLRLRPAS